MSGESHEVTEIKLAESGFSKQLLTPGPHTELFIARHPRLREVQVMYPQLYIANPGKPEAIFAFAGYRDDHTLTFLHEYGKNLVDRTNDTLITIGWPSFTDVYDVRWRCIADYVTENHPRGFKLFGTSFGGRESLVGLTILNQLAKEEGFEVPVEATAVVVSPISKHTVQPRKIMGTRDWLMLQAAKVEPLFERASLYAIPKLMPRNIRLPGGKSIDLWGIRAQTVRARELARGEPFKQGDFPENTIVHYFGTDPEGNKDPMVNQPKAINELEAAGIQVVPHWYKPNPEFAHYPAEEETSRLMGDVLDLFSRADKNK